MPEFHADQQQVERVGKCAFDRKLAARDPVLEKHQRRMHADIGRGDCTCRA